MHNVSKSIRFVTLLKCWCIRVCVLHVIRRGIHTVIRWDETISINGGKKDRGRPREILLDIIDTDMDAPVVTILLDKAQRNNQMRILHCGEYDKE